MWGYWLHLFTNDQVTEDVLTDYWDNLNCLRSPNLTEEVSFYFTRYGNLRFEGIIPIIFITIPKELEPKLHKIVVNRANRGQVAYRDHFQVALIKII